MNSKSLLLAGTIAGLFAVILGAFGAHGLEKLLSSKTLATYQTGVEYQFYHSFALIVAGMFTHFWSGTKVFKTAGLFFLIGIFLFSGSLYLYSLTGIRAIAIITPIGGLSFIIGWVLLIIGIIKTKI